MIGEVPACKPGIAIPGHRRDRALRIDPAVPARNLPHPVDEAVDFEVGGEP